MQRFRLLMMAALAAAATLGLAPAAQAQVQFAINIQSGAINVTVFDGGPGDLNPLPNQITVVSGAAGVPVLPGFNANIDTALTNAPGNPANQTALLDLTYTVASTGTPGGSVQITASATGFTIPGAGLNPLTLNSSIGGTSNGPASTTGQSWLNDPNVLFGLGAFTPGPQGPFASTGGPIAFSNSAEFTGNVDPPFALTNRVNITLGANALATGDLQTTVTGVPAPAGLLLALGGAPALGAGALLRRRLAKKA